MEQQHLGSLAGAAGLTLVAAVGATIARRASNRVSPSAAKLALRTLPVLFGLRWLAINAPGFVADRMEDCRDEPAELKNRRLMIRCFRHSLSKQARRVWAQTGLLGRDMRALFPPAYSSLLELQIRAAMPQGPTVWRREIIWVQLAGDGAGWAHVSAVLDPSTSWDVLRMSPQMAHELGMQPGQRITYSIAGHEFNGLVAVEVPDQASATQVAQSEAAAASRELSQEQLARRATDIIAERQRCLVVPAGPMQHLLRAGISINMS